MKKLSLFFVHAVNSKHIIKSEFLVRAGSAHSAMDKVELLNKKETEAGDKPLYPAGCGLMCCPVEFETDVICL